MQPRPQGAFHWLEKPGKSALGPPWVLSWPEWLNTLIRLANIAVVTEGIREI